ncbi:MAG TPA: fumarate hydratase [Candidatus Copromorpha excrementigallinarum]|uniref:Fumarate hydratase n=1 Tax=Candidatus Allocopromorpha excrementigallinarum TaxID=2840742 RepID=A0A9D1I0L5_9FIRM|nr:fumarate hydratase [Candidatus Copromorpha excrementigallinarum]
MREIDVKMVEEAVAGMCVEANYFLGSDVKGCIAERLSEETWPVASDILKSIRKNIEKAGEGVFPLCQDTGMACVFLHIGQDIHFVGGSLEEAVNRGVARGYKEGYLRKSIVEDPLRRINTGDNTPACISYRITEGDRVRIIVAPKGFGSENMSAVRMLPPSAGEEGVKDFVVNTCLNAGANPCPPIVVGVGIGGTFDRAALMAKEALLIPLDAENADPYYRDMEEELLERINYLGIGPQGFGGRTTALGVKIKTAPTHIAGLPVAVNINCHVSRHKEVVL